MRLFIFLCDRKFPCVRVCVFVLVSCQPVSLSLSFRESFETPTPSSHIAQVSYLRTFISILNSWPFLLLLCHSAQSSFIRITTPLEFHNIICLYVHLMVQTITDFAMSFGHLYLTQEPLYPSNLFV